MNTLHKLAATLGIFAFVSGGAALAQMSGYSSVHKWTDSASGKTYVYVPGQTAGSPVTGFTSPKAPKTKVVTLNNCGWGSFTKSTTSPPTNITGANWPAQNGTAPTCTRDATTGNYTDSNPAAVGTLIDDGTKLWVKGGSGPGSVTLNIETSGAITTKANACGFVRVPVSTSRPMTTFSIGTQSYTLTSVPSVTNPMICRKVGTSSFTYVPAQ